MNSFHRISLVALVTLGLSHPLVAQGNGQGNGGGAEDLRALIAPLAAEPLSPAEASAILSLREEEKLAQDVYLTLAKKWNLPVFTNIANSEQSHRDALGFLVTRYHLSDPTPTAVGQFRTPAVQKLYNDLVTRGSLSLQEALKVGAEVEDLDLNDLNRTLPLVDNTDLRVLIQNLAKGSRNHLRSFLGQLERAGATYSPRYLARAEFDAIVRINRETAPITDPNYQFLR